MKKSKHQNFSLRLVQMMLLFFGSTIFGQEILTIDQAVRIALENNYDIKIASNDVKIAEQNVSLANAGILPAINGVVTNNNSILDTEQTQQDGTVRELDNARNFNLNYGIQLNWNVFNGFGMFARYTQLKELKRLDEAEFKMTVFTRISDVYSTYYDLVQQKKQLQALDTAIAISDLRLNTAKNRYTIGKAAKLEVLNAEVDMNSDQTAMLRQKELFANTKILLNEILARDVNTQFDVPEEVIIDETLLLPNLLELAEKQNPELQTQVINKRVAELQLKQVKGARLPLVNITSGYNFTRQEASLGFITQSSGKGLTYGINASVPIFNGGLQNRNERIAKIQIENSDLAIQQQKQLLQSQLSSAYQTYLTNLQLTKLEAKNLEIARENMDITLAKFKIGSIAPLEFREAQLNYVNAKVRNSNAQFAAKVSEISLKELAGSLPLTGF